MPLTYKRDLEKWLNRLRTTAPDAKQDRLTRKHIIQNLPSILHDLGQLRDVIDGTVQQFLIEHPDISVRGLNMELGESFQAARSGFLQSRITRFLETLPPGQLKRYPIGECTTITRIARNLIVEERCLPPTEGFCHLREFIASGGIFQVIWGGIRHTYFQTAFQAGTYYFDIANDTVDISKPKIAHAFLEESGFNDIHSYDEYMNIKADYHHVRIFINNCFPRLFPYFPLLKYSADKNWFRFDTSMYMARLSISTGFRIVLDALNSGRFQNRLDKQDLGQINASLQKLGNNRRFKDMLEFRIMDKEEMRRQLYDSAHLSPYEHMKRLKTYKRVVEFLNFAWDKDKLYHDILIS